MIYSFIFFLAFFGIRMNSYVQHLYDNIFKNDFNNCTLRRRFTGILLIIIALMIYINMSKLQKKSNPCKTFLVVNSTARHLRESRGPPYLAFIISSSPRRFNATLINLNTALPGYFNIQHKQPVSHNDSRILRHGDKQVSSLLLSYIDMWRDFGAKPEVEFTDNDWVFLFEDDVNVASVSLIKSFNPQIAVKWNISNPHTLLAGSKRSSMMDNS
jgi:hypothetical protein